MSASWLRSPAGKAIDRYFSEHITGPLGMNDTGFVITEQQRARQASLHVRDAGGKLVAKPFEKLAADISLFRRRRHLFDRAGLSGPAAGAAERRTVFAGTSLLRPDTVAMMSTNQIGNIEAGILKTANPALSNDVDFFPGVHLRWGLGHMINVDPVRDGRAAGSLTWAGLFNTYYWIDPKKRIAGVIMMQILPFVDKQALVAYRQFERGIYHALG